MLSVFPQTCSHRMNAMLAMLDALPLGIVSYETARREAEGCGKLPEFEAAIDRAIGVIDTRLAAVDQVHPKGRRALEHRIEQCLDEGADPAALSAAVTSALAQRSAIEHITLREAEGDPSRPGLHIVSGWDAADATLRAICLRADLNEIGVRKVDVEIAWAGGLTLSLRYGAAHPLSGAHVPADLARMAVEALAFSLGLRCPRGWSNEQYDRLRCAGEPHARRIATTCDLPGVVELLLGLVTRDGANALG